jgi:hypothetical protein
LFHLGSISAKPIRTTGEVSLRQLPAAMVIGSGKRRRSGAGQAVKEVAGDVRVPFGGDGAGKAHRNR